jgi:hypothetical protein
MLCVLLLLLCRGLLYGNKTHLPAYEKLNTLADYNKAWRQVIDLFKLYNAPVAWQLNINR